MKKARQIRGFNALNEIVVFSIKIVGEILGYFAENE